MPRRDDRRGSTGARSTSRRSASARGASSRTSRSERAASSRSQSRTAARSRGSSRPESATFQRSYDRQQGRARKAVSNDRAQSPPSTGRKGSYTAVRGTSRRPRAHDAQGEYVETSVGELRRADRMERAKKSSRRYFMRIAIIVALVIAVVIGGVVLYNSPAFAITNVAVNGVEHLTSDEMAQLANVPKDSTLLRVDTATIEKRIKQNAWVADVQVNRVFPDTLEINVTERSIFAVVEVPTSVGASVKQWAIASDHVWLMPIPDATSDAAKTTSSKIYEDAASALHVVDVPFGTKAEIGEVCTDSNINNALDILSGLTTELSGRIVQVSAAGTAETMLLLDNGVEVAFGKAEDIRDKERVILQILADNEDNVAYINVRMVETPTWRAV